LLQGRARANGAADGTIYQLTMMAEQPGPQRTTVWFVGNDSAEANYFNVARSGYKFDANGRLIRADWTGTTYCYRIHRVVDIDVDAIARAGIERSPIGGKASARVAKM
jgi:hypothetical protein